MYYLTIFEYKVECIAELAWRVCLI